MNSAQTSKIFNIALIGLDTSHSVEFTRALQGDTPPEARVPGMRVTGALRFASPFQSEEGQDGRQKLLESWGVAVSRNIEEALKGAQAIFLEINDPALHLEYFKKVVGMGLPIFIDKPLAATPAEGRLIADLAATHQASVWSSSSLRYLPGLTRVAGEIPMGERKLANVYGPLGKAPAGSSVVWYGVHGMEMLHTLMGPGAKSVRAAPVESGLVVTVDFGGGRRGVVELNHGLYQYGGRLHGDKVVKSFAHEGEHLYSYLLKEIGAWLAGGPLPVPLSHSQEVLALLAASEKSAARDGSLVTLAEG